MDFPFSMGMELRPRAPSAPAGAPLKQKKILFEGPELHSGKIQDGGRTKVYGYFGLNLSS